MSACCMSYPSFTGCEQKGADIAARDPALRAGLLASNRRGLDFLEGLLMHWFAGTRATRAVRHAQRRRIFSPRNCVPSNCGTGVRKRRFGDGGAKPPSPSFSVESIDGIDVRRRRGMPCRERFPVESSHAAVRLAGRWPVAVVSQRARRLAGGTEWALVPARGEGYVRGR